MVRLVCAKRKTGKHHTKSEAKTAASLKSITATMTSIPLTANTIQSYLGGESFNYCQEISSIHLEYDVEQDVANVQASIPASTTNRGSYEIAVSLRSNGRSILGSSCSCPVGYRCKHIYKVLCRIARSAQEPIHGPDQHHRARAARQRRLADQMEHASVFIAFTCKSELDSGSDYRRSYFVKDNFDQQVLGVFFSKRQANQCAKEYVQDELGYDVDDEYMDDDEDDDEMDDADDDTASFVWDGSDDGLYDDGNEFDKVWVERRAVEDASQQFHR